METQGSDTGGPGLKRSLTLAHAVLYGVGVTIGAGIYVLVGVAAGRSGMQAPLAFLLAVFPMALTAVSFAELGTRMPVSASEAAYVEAAFRRRRLSLLMGLLVVSTAAISAATISVGSAGYLGVFLGLDGRLIILLVVLAMGLIAGLATTQSIAFAGLLTLIEVGGLLLIIAAGLATGNDVFGRLPELAFAPGDLAIWAGIGGTALIAVFAFIGFEHLVNISEELKQPSRALPRALFLTLGITALLYMTIMWIAVTTVTPAELAASEAPLALVFQRLTGLPLVTMSLIAAVATLNGIVVHLIMIARVLYGMADQKMLPAPLARVSRTTRTPLVATGLAVGVVLALALLLPLEGLADLAARGTLLIFAAINLALIRIKRRGDPLPSGAFAAPGWVPYAALVSALLLFALGFA